MNLAELLFNNQQNTSWEKNKEKIIEYLSKQKDEVTIKSRELSLEELAYRVKHPDYLNDLEVTIKEGYIELIYNSLDIWDEIKKYIQKSITKLNILSSFLKDDYQYFSKFPNLKEISVNEFRLNSEELNYLKNHTNITIINSNYMFIDEKEYINNIDALIVKDKMIIINGLIVQNNNSINDDWLNIYFHNIDIPQLFDLLNKTILNNYKRIIIESLNGIQYSINLERKNITISDNNFSNALMIIKYFKKNNIDLDNVEINLENIDYTKLDLTELKEMDKLINISVRYGIVSVASLDDFITLKETVKWYRSLISDFNLSPVEKLMFAYDIMKTFKYRENEEDKSMARYPDKILKSGDIVCVGYANFLKEILKSMDNNIGISCASVTYTTEKDESIGHERNLVRIDDSKYNIHGIFALDPTWDSEVTSDKTRKVLGDSYTSLDLYSYFLIPYKDYNKTFGKDTMPLLFECFNSDKYKITDWPISQSLKELFGKEVNDEQLVKEYISVKRPTLRQFLDMLYNVRIAEGYEKEYIEKELIKVEQINSSAISFMQKHGEEIDFFQDESPTRR